MSTERLIPRNALLSAGLMLSIGLLASAAPRLIGPRMEVTVGATTLSRGVVDVGPSHMGPEWFTITQGVEGRTLTWHSNGRALILIDTTSGKPLRYVAADGETIEPIQDLRRSERITSAGWIAFEYLAPGPTGPRTATRHTDGMAHIDMHVD